MGKKGMEKRARTILGLHILTPVTLPSSADNYLQLHCTCFALRAASHLASRVYVVEVLVIDVCCNIFQLSHKHRTMMMYWFSSAAQPLLAGVCERSFACSSLSSRGGRGGVALEVDGVKEVVEVVEVESHLK
jgi:hypothetical protein